MVDRERSAVEETDYISDGEKRMRITMLEDQRKYIENSLDREKHKAMIEEGSLRMSYGATRAALLINLYRDKPILRMPYNILEKVTDVDELFTLWRYRHSQMVLRMLGKKMGTGGSSGHGYLSKTAEKHHIFRDLHNISTLLIPRSDLPDLPKEIEDKLGFKYNQE